MIAHLLKWKYQPERRSKSGVSTVRTQRAEAKYLLDEAPSLRRRFDEPDWLNVVWMKARNLAETETGIDFDSFPHACPWPMTPVLETGFSPE